MKRTILIFTGIVALLLLLGGAAYLAGQLTRTQQQTVAKANEQALPRKLVTPAAGLPSGPPTARGDLERRVDNSLFICDPPNTMTVNSDGKVENETECSPDIKV